MMNSASPQLLTAQYQLTEADLLTAFRYRHWGDPEARRRLFQRWAGTVVGALALAVVLWRLLGDPSLSTIIPVVGVTFFWPCLLWIQPSGVVRQLRKMPGVFQPSWITLRPDALVVGNLTTEGTRDWQAIQNLVVTGQHTLFIFGPFDVLPVPWRAFDTPSEAQRFSELAREYWLAAKSAPASDAPALKELIESLGPERLELHYRLELEDLSAFFRSQLRWTRKSAPSFLMLAVVCGWVGYSNFDWPGLAGGLLLGLLGFPRLFVWNAIRQARSAPGVLYDHSLYLSPLGLVSVTPGVGLSRMDWSAVTELNGMPGGILLQRGPNHAILIPRRAFASSEEADRFLAQATCWRLPHVSSSKP